MMNNKRNMLFQENGKSVMFSLKEVTEEELLELTDLIKKNGGSIVDRCDFIFTNPDMYTGEKSAFDKRYIQECVMTGKILNLKNYMIKKKTSPNCLTTLFLTCGEQCDCPRYASSNTCEAQMFMEENRNAILRIEHNYVRRDPGKENRLRILSTEEMNNIPFSASLYIPDETQSQQLINREENIEIQRTQGNTIGDSQLPDSIDNPDGTQSQQLINREEIIEIQRTQGNTIGDYQRSDLIYNPDDTQLQSINGIMHMNVISNEIEVPTTGNGPNERFSSEIPRTVGTKNSSDSNVETDKDVCDVKKEPCLRTETERNKQISTSNALPCCSEIEARDTETHKSTENIKITRENIGNLKIRNEKTELRNKNERKQTNNSVVGDTVGLFHNIVARSQKKSTEKSLRDTNESRLTFDIESDNDEATPNERQQTEEKRDCETDSNGNYSPLIDSEFMSDSNLPKSGRENIQTTLSKKNLSKRSTENKTSKVTSANSEQLIDLISSSDEDSPPRIVRNSKSIFSPNCSKASTSNSQIRKPKPYATRNFMPWEQREMVKYLIENDCIADARGNRVWQRFISDGFLTHRTYQSLQNNFRRSILPNIQRYPMNAKQRAEFNKLKAH